MCVSVSKYITNIAYLLQVLATHAATLCNTHTSLRMATEWLKHVGGILCLVLATHAATLCNTHTSLRMSTEWLKHVGGILCL